MISESDDNADKKIEEMQNEKYLEISPSDSSENFVLRELFVYSLNAKEAGFKIIDRLHIALKHKNPFRNFKNILEEYPAVREDWFKYERKHFEEQAKMWLEAEGLEIRDFPISNIDVKELTKEEILKLPNEVLEFSPIECMNCRNKNEMETRFFLPNIRIESKYIDKEVRKIMNKKFNISNYGVFSDSEAEILNIAKCPKCGSEDIFCDY